MRKKSAAAFPKHCAPARRRVTAIPTASTRLPPRHPRVSAPGSVIAAVRRRNLASTISRPGDGKGQGKGRGGEWDGGRTKLTDYLAQDIFPAVEGDRIYFFSDRDATAGEPLRYDTNPGRRVTHAFTDSSVKSRRAAQASASRRRFIHRFDLKIEKAEKIVSRSRKTRHRPQRHEDCRRKPPRDIARRSRASIARVAILQRAGQATFLRATSPDARQP